MARKWLEKFDWSALDNLDYSAWDDYQKTEKKKKIVQEGMQDINNIWAGEAKRQNTMGAKVGNIADGFISTLGAATFRPQIAHSDASNEVRKDGLTADQKREAEKMKLNPEQYIAFKRYSVGGDRTPEQLSGFIKDLRAKKSDKPEDYGNTKKTAVEKEQEIIDKFNSDNFGTAGAGLIRPYRSDRFSQEFYNDAFQEALALGAMKHGAITNDMPFLKMLGVEGAMNLPGGVAQGVTNVLTNDKDDDFMSGAKEIAGQSALAFGMGAGFGAAGRGFGKATGLINDLRPNSALRQGMDNALTASRINQIDELADLPNAGAMREYLADQIGDRAKVAQIPEDKLISVYQQVKANPKYNDVELKQVKAERAAAAAAEKATVKQAQDDLLMFNEQLKEAKTQLKQTETAMTAGKSDMTLKQLAKIASEHKKDIRNLEKQISGLQNQYPDITTEKVAADFIPGAKPIMEEVDGLPVQNIADETPVKPLVEEPVPIIEEPKNMEILNKPVEDVAPVKDFDQEITNATLEGDNAKAAALIKERENIGINEGQLNKMVNTAKNRDELEDFFINNKDQIFDTLYEMKRTNGDGQVDAFIQSLKKQADGKLGESLYGTTALDDFRSQILDIPRNDNLQFYKELDRSLSDGQPAPKFDAEVEAKRDAAFAAFEKEWKKTFGKDAQVLDPGAMYDHLEARYGSRAAAQMMEEGAAATFSKNGQLAVGISDLDAPANRQAFRVWHEKYHGYLNVLVDKNTRAKLIIAAEKQLKNDPEFQTYTKLRMEDDKGLGYVGAVEEYLSTKMAMKALKLKGYKEVSMDEAGRIIISSKPTGLLGTARTLYERVVGAMESFFTEKNTLEKTFRDLYFAKPDRFNGDLTTKSSGFRKDAMWGADTIDDLKAKTYDPQYQTFDIPDEGDGLAFIKEGDGKQDWDSWFDNISGLKTKASEAAGGGNNKLPSVEELTQDSYNFDYATKTGNRVKKALGVDSELSMKVRERWEDSRVRLKKLQQKVGTTSDEMNAYQKIENATSIIEARQTAAAKIQEDIIADMGKRAKSSGVEIRDFKKEVESYAVARSGLERIQQHGTDVVYGRQDVNQTIAELTEIVAKTESSPHFAAIKESADELNGMSKAVLDTLYDGGSEDALISKAEYDRLNQTYPNHINFSRDFSVDAEGNPLSNYFTQEDFSSYGGGSPSVLSTGLKKVKGGDFAVDDVLANQAQMLNMAIARFEKNKAAKAVINFANYYNSLPDNAAEATVGRSLFEIFEGKPNGNSENVITALYGGKPVSVRVNDPAMAKAITDMGVEKMTGLYKMSQFFNGIRGQLATQWKLSFAIRNKGRDIQEMINYIGSMEEMKGQSSKALKSTFSKDLKVVRDFHHGVKNADTSLYQQMIDDGGAIGGLAKSTKGEIKKNIETLLTLQEGGAKANAIKAGKAIAQFFENWNDVAENSSRFTVYKTALDAGMSRERAAWLAKEAGINFQRHGTGKGLRSMYLFFNPSVQGTARTWRAWANNPKEFAKFTMALGGAVWGANEWNDSIDENWRDDTRLSEYTRNTNLIVLSPWQNSKGEHYIIKVPLGFSYVPIKTVIDQGIDVAKGKSKAVDAAKTAAKSFVIGYNPVAGDTSLSSALPTQFGWFPARFAGELMSNENFMGTPIKPKGKENLPGSWQYYDSTTEEPVGRAAVAASRFLSDITGGKKGNRGLIEISPESMLYGLEQLISGAGRDITRGYNTVSNIVKGEGVKTSDIPFVESFISELRPSRKGEMEMYDILGRRDDQSVREAIAKQRIRERYDSADSIPQSEIENLRNIGMTSRQINGFLDEFDLSRTSRSFDQLSEDDAASVWDSLSEDTKQELIENGVAPY